MKPQLLLIFVILSINFSQAQIGLEEHNLFNSSDLIYQNSSKYADIDGDGDLDVVFTNYQKISWFENIDGLGKFSRQKVIQSNGVGDFAIEDFDGDTDLDIAFTNATGGVQWIQNLDGQGNFGVPQIIDPSGSPYNIISSDIDGDGDMDLVTTTITTYNQRLSWYENTDGQGNFGPEATIDTTINNVYYLSAADLDGDNDLDLFMTSAEYSGIIVWFKNLDGQGNFGPKVIIANAQGPRYLSAVDLDSDGDLDIVSTTILDDDIVWYKNIDGQGNFSNNRYIATNLPNIKSVIPADIDNDGDFDILVENSNSLSWYENTTGFGNFGSQQVFNVQATGAVTDQNLNFDDLDNDGYKDILRSTMDNIKWYKNSNGSGSIEEGEIIGGFLESPRQVLSGDLNGDGFEDILIGQVDRIFWIQNKDGNGNYGYENLIVNNITFKELYIADIDNDGDNDLILRERNKISWMENIDGLANFGPIQTISTDVPFSTSVCTADLDGDGDLDIISTSTGDDKVAWYENTDGQGAFGPQQIITTSFNGPHGSIAVDVDNDGDKDIIVALDGRVSLFRNINGLGTFDNEETITSVLSSIDDLSAEDMDSDGDKDLVFTEGSDKLYYYDNIDGLGTYELKQKLITNGNNAVKIAIVTDLDGDDDFDIVVAMDNEIVWHENLDGQGTFEIGGEQLLFTEEEKPSSLYISDINGDGKKDILATVLSLNKLSWYESLGVLGNSIVGSIRVDLDLNGCSPSDLDFKNIMVRTSNGTNSFATFTNKNGDYVLNTNEGYFNTNILDALPSYYTSTPSSHDSTFIGLGNSDTADFCVTPNVSVNDLNIAIYPLTDARPGFNAQYEIVYRNVGTTIINGDINLTFIDTKLNFLSASEPISNQTANSVTFDYTGLSPFESRTILVGFHVSEPPTTEIGDQLSFIATINPTASDLTEEDNTFTFEQIVIGSYDPNDIQVLEGESIFIDETDNYLHYIIRFQNTGTASAINVSVTNELDPNLDWTTLQIENISHPYRIEITDRNQVEFIFNNINLPDSTSNEPGSHGYIQYKIKPKNTIEIGDFVQNNAAIYFDFNPPILTNTVTTTVIDHLGVEENSLNFITVYPVPASDILNIKSNSIIVEAIVYNELGQNLLSIQNPEGINFLNITSLSNGIYFIKLKDLQQNSISKKFIKQD